MSYEDVKKYAIEYFESQDGIDVRTEMVTKADIAYDAIILSRGTVGVCLNVDTIYEVYKSNENVVPYFKNVLLVLEDAVTKFCTTAIDIQSWEKCKNLVRGRVINYKRNISYLEDKVHKRILDLAIIYTITWTQEECCYSMTVNKSILEAWNISVETLDDVANKNMRKDGYLCLSIEDVLRQNGMDESLLGELDINIRLYVLTNVSKTQGAALMFTPGVLRECADRLGSTDLVVIPSSKHEVLLLNNKMGADIMRNMVREVNATQVAIDDYLADNVYLYKYEEDTLVVY